MSISSRKEERERRGGEGYDGSSGDGGNKKKFVRIWRIESSKEFILLAMILVSLLSVSFYNPYQLLQIAKENLENTERIIQSADDRYGNLSMFINMTEAERKTMGIDVVNILLLYQMEQAHKMDLLLDNNEISHKQYDLVQHNTTHIYVNVTDEAIAEGMDYTDYYIPFPMTIDNMIENK